MNIPDKLKFKAAQKATLVVQQVQTEMVSGIDFTNAGVHYTIDPNAQTVTATVPGVGRPQQRIMGDGTATAYKDGHTEQDRRAAFLTQLGLDASQIVVAPVPAAAS